MREVMASQGVISDRTRADFEAEHTLLSWLYADIHRRFALCSNGPRENAQTRSIVSRGFTDVAEDLQRFERVSSVGDAVDAYALRNALRLALRRLSLHVASTICLDNWQSPSIAASTCDRSGVFPETVRDYHTDYRRCWFALGQQYENTFRQEFVQPPNNWQAEVALTSCGMSAFTTALIAARRAHGRQLARALVHPANYHENLFVLRELGGVSCSIRVAASEEEFIAQLREWHPELVYLDVLSNTAEVQAPNLVEISAAIPEQTTLIIDNTCLGPQSAVYSLLERLPTRARLVVVESLVKLHSHGLDVANAGICVCCATSSNDFCDLKRLRTHLGTQIAEREMAALPSPSRVMLEQRLRRLFRNNAFLAARIKSLVGMRGVTVRSRPTSPFLAIDLDGGNRQAFIDTMVARARRLGVDIVHGTAFGFDTTRVYNMESALPSLRSFLRVSAGMETIDELEKIVDVLPT